MKYIVKHTKAELIGKNIILDIGLNDEFTSINPCENGKIAIVII
jgi:hypothetical protein